MSSVALRIDELLRRGNNQEEEEEEEEDQEDVKKNLQVEFREMQIQIQHQLSP